MPPQKEQKHVKKIRASIKRQSKKKKQLKDSLKKKQRK